MPIAVPMPPPGQELFPMEGLRVWRNPLNQFVVVHTHYTADPARRGDWRLRASPKYGGLRSWRWRKEQEIDWEAASGRLIFEQWDPDTHQVRPFTIPDHWPRWILWDPGWNNPSAINWAAVDTDTEPNDYGFLPIHIYREFYKPRHSPEACASVIVRASGLTDATVRSEWIEEIIVDPGAKQEHQSASDRVKDESAETTLSRFSDELQVLGADIPVDTGKNDKSNATEELVMRVGSYWVDRDGVPLVSADDRYREPSVNEVLDGATQIPPTLFFHHTCVHGPREMGLYRWADWVSAQVEERHNLQEKPIDKDDHVITNLIRFVNRLADYRLADGPELSAFVPRRRPTDWKPLDQEIEEAHRTRAGRYRKRMTREASR